MRFGARRGVNGGGGTWRADAARALVLVVTLSLCGVGRADPAPSTSAPTATPVPSLTVIAPRRPEAPPAPAAVHAFVQSHAVPSRIGQLARWGSGICPKTAGLGRDQSEAVIHRVMALAQAVGAPTADLGKCRANLAIIVTDKPQAVLDYVKARQPALLGYH